MNALLAIQRELKVAKSNFNKFGGFRYRSCENILEAVKPILEKHDAELTLTDDLVLLGEWVFVKATATLKVAGSQFLTTAYARLDREKKGMDSAQLTGSASSYARKYALNGLFLIDDESDPDAQEPPLPQTLPNGYGTIPASTPVPPPVPPLRARTQSLPPLPGGRK